MMRLRNLALLPLLGLLGACSTVVLSPSGDVAAQQGRLVMISTGLMLLIIVPVMALTVLFAWRYRASNKDATYEPDWDHSTALELVIWSAPLMIIICLGAITWASTHLLDPYRPLARLSAEKSATQAGVAPLKVDVVALDWKWLFLYPEYGIASVNELVAPVDRPIDFRITASSVMNSFYVPALAGQIYAMPGMQSQLHAVINKPGAYEGFSANYSGAGFSNMRFTFHGASQTAFNDWVAKVRGAGGALDREAYLKLERPSEKEPVRYYARATDGLFDLIRNMCVEPGKMCMHEMAAIDAKGGLGLAGIANTRPIAYDKFARRGAVFGPEKTYLASLCTLEDARGDRIVSSRKRPLSTEPLRGAGLPLPPLTPFKIQSLAPSAAPLPSNT